MLKYLMVIPTRKKIRTFDHERCIVGYLIELFQHARKSHFENTSNRLHSGRFTQH